MSLTVVDNERNGVGYGSGGGAGGAGVATVANDTNFSVARTLAYGATRMVVSLVHSHSFHSD